MLVNDLYYSRLVEDDGKDSCNIVSELEVNQYTTLRYPHGLGTEELAVSLMAVPLCGGHRVDIRLSHADARKLAKELLEAAGGG